MPEKPKSSAPAPANAKPDPKTEKERKQLEQKLAERLAAWKKQSTELAQACAKADKELEDN